MIEAETREEFGGTFSIQVYSVQACIPKETAVIWNSEFVQAEELFNQPPTLENCLRDNRYTHNYHHNNLCMPPLSISESTGSNPNHWFKFITQSTFEYPNFKT